LLKKGVGGVASAAGSDARSRDEGDAGGASGRSGDDADGPAPPQPLAVAGLLLKTILERKVLSARESFLRRELQKARHDTRIHFSAPC